MHQSNLKTSSSNSNTIQKPNLTEPPPPIPPVPLQQSNNGRMMIDDEEPNVFGFFDDEDKKGTQLSKQGPSSSLRKKVDDEDDIDNIPHVDLTENADYLLHFGYSNGFVWNEEVLLSPPFSSSFGSSAGSNSGSCKNRTFPILLAERLRRQRIAQETKVTEIHIDD